MNKRKRGLQGDSHNMISYLKNNMIPGFKTSPKQELKLSIYLIILFALFSFIVGEKGNLFRVGLLVSPGFFILPLSLFIFPSLLEEMFFRGILIPNNTRDKGSKSIIIRVLTSTILFMLWHPFNAVTINLTANALFFNPYFLSIVFCLGLICSVTYVYSKSLWVPILIHWFTVLIWVFFLGGRNLILEVLY